MTKRGIERKNVDFRVFSLAVLAQLPVFPELPSLHNLTSLNFSFPSYKEGVLVGLL